MESTKSSPSQNLDLTLEELQHALTCLNGTSEVDCKICSSARAKIETRIALLTEQPEQLEVPEKLKALGVTSIERVKGRCFLE